MKNFISILIISLVLAGCNTNPIIKPTTYVVVKPTPILLLPCNISRPPQISDYLAMSKEDREKSMAGYSTDLLNDLNICNQRWVSFSKWFDDQQKAYANEK